MMTHAYDSIYLSKASRTIGNMLHDAVLEYNLNGTDFLNQFIQADVASQFETGNPNYLAGKSGLELFIEVMEKTTGKEYPTPVIKCFERSSAYWVGWMLTHYQWYSGRSFKNILETIPYDELIGLYDTLHETDIQKSYEVLDSHFSTSECKLKTIRKKCELTQETLSTLSGVSLNTIRAYERKSKDLKKAQFDIVVKLANTLKCDVIELFD